MAGDDSDEPGVLGNLPRSRPGRRSEKRTGATRARAKADSAGSPRAGGAAQRAKGGGAARTSSAASRGKPAAKPRPARSGGSSTQRPRPAAKADSRSGDPLSQAVRLAGKVAETGVKTAVGLIRRLPGGH